MMNRLAVRRRVVLGAYAVTVAAYAAAVAMILVELGIAVWIVNLTTVFYILVVRALDKGYDRAFARANLTMSCGQRLNQLQIADKGGLTREDVRAGGLFPLRREGKELVWGMDVQGRGGDVRVRICELTAYCEIFGEKEKLALLNGLWMEARLPGSTGLHLTLVQHGALDPDTAAAFYAGQGLTRLPLGEGALRDGFTLYGDEAGAKAAARFARRCVPLAQQAGRAGHKLVLSLHGDAVHVFLSGRSLTFRTPIRGRLTPEIVGWDRLPELSLLLTLAKESGPQKSSP